MQLRNVKAKHNPKFTKKTIDWISLNFKNSQSVVQAKIENEFIRIEGFKESLVCVNGMYGKDCRDGKFILEISIKDGKYKMEITDIEQYLEATNNRSGQNYPARWMPIKNTESSYERGGKKHVGEISSYYKDFVEIPIFFNKLNKNLEEFILESNILSKKSDW